MNGRAASVSHDDAEAAQKAHYNRIFAEYEAHYDDRTSQRYRQRFMYDPMFEGIDLRGAEVLEAMCGSGQTTGYLLAGGARVTGLDLSDVAIERFRTRWPATRVIRASILESGLAAESFDGVVVLGGLHHVHPNVDDAVNEIYRVLKPGGWFCFGEPHAGSLPDLARRWWYRRDSLFEAGEAAIDLEALQHDNAGRFDVEIRRYVGSIAYLLVANSMVFRLPRKLKPFYAPPLCFLEGMLAPLHGRVTSCFVVCRWRKRRD